jgi:hypothetical protein
LNLFPSKVQLVVTRRPYDISIENTFLCFKFATLSSTFLADFNLPGTPGFPDTCIDKSSKITDLHYRAQKTFLKIARVLGKPAAYFFDNVQNSFLS